MLKWVELRKVGIIVRQAEAGDPRAQHRLGFIYSDGRGVPQNYAEAVKWFRKAAEKGHGTAQLNLGYLLFEGRGVERDLIEAYQWTFLALQGGPGLFGLFVKDAAYQQLARLRAMMTPDQITEGQKLANDFRRGGSHPAASDEAEWAGGER